MFAKRSAGTWRANKWTDKSGEERPTRIRSSYEFIPKLKGKKVVIRLLSGGQPVIGILESFNPYELQIQTAKGSQLVFKRAIATIEAVDEQQSYRAGG
jgi:sRNA-binding regulator protein Hfq